MTECGIVKGDYSWRLQNVSSANQIKSRIIPAEKKRETTKYESCAASSTNAVSMFLPACVERFDQNVMPPSSVCIVTICRICK